MIHLISPSRMAGGRLFGEVFGFGIFGILSAGLTFFLTIFLHEIVLISVRVAYAVGLVAAILLNFVLCRNVIFRSNESANWQLFFFVLSSFFFRSLEYGAFLFQELTIHLPYGVAILAIKAIFFLSKFWYYKMLVFGHARER